MIKHLNIFYLSFITYILLIIASPYITAQTWAGICLYMFIGALIYQFLFLCHFSVKENIESSRSLFLYFVCAISSVGLYIILYYNKIFFFGYEKCAFLAGDCYGTYYGFEAIRQDDWSNLVYIPYLIFNIIIILIYYRSTKKVSNNQSSDDASSDDAIYVNKNELNNNK